jgi:hypothetical protein
MGSSGVVPGLVAARSSAPVDWSLFMSFLHNEWLEVSRPGWVRRARLRPRRLRRQRGLLPIVDNVPQVEEERKTLA